MYDNSSISKSLVELSDAIEQLAMIIAQQKDLDKELYVKPLSLLVNKVRESTDVLQDQIVLSNQDGKFQKGYIEDWLQSKNIYVGKGKSTLKVSEKLYRVADYLCDHYNHLESFYAQLKRHQVLKKDFVALSKKESIKYIRNWCNMLHRNKIIDSFTKLDQYKTDIDINEIHEATLFINGNWLEVYLRKELSLWMKTHMDKIFSYDVLTQVEIVKPSLRNTEVDLFVMINEKDILVRM